MNGTNNESENSENVNSSNTDKPKGDTVISINNNTDDGQETLTNSNIPPITSAPETSSQPKETHRLTDQAVISLSKTSTLVKAEAKNQSHHKRRPKPKGKHYRPIPKPPANQPISAQPKSRKSAFVTVTHGIRKIKETCHHKCKICDVVSDSQAAANAHYRAKHPPLKCPDCTQTFNNPCLLRCHKYNHRDLWFPCCTCNKNFAFESDLNNHRLKHRCHPGHQCNHRIDTGICGKSFMLRVILINMPKYMMDTSISASNAVILPWTNGICVPTNILIRTWNVTSVQMPPVCDDLNTILK